MCGAVTNGFFADATYNDDGETLHIAIPFDGYGIDFVKQANTESILSGIILSRYGVKRTVEIKSGAGIEKRAEKWENRRTEMLKAAEEEDRARMARERVEAARVREEEAKANDPFFGFDEKSGISSATGQNSRISDTVYKMGPTTYDVASSESVYGEDFEIIEPTPLSDFSRARGRSVFLGTVF